jgi:beta-1,4-N-acetylglucosaminyltransferase
LGLVGHREVIRRQRNPTFDAGSGTLLEALGARKKVIVVVNESLMDNHQVELARQLGDMGCLVYSTPR